VREERPGDVEPVDGVLRRAFGGHGEADLVRALRGRVEPCLALVRTGLARCRAAGHDVVFVLGHTRFYPRFGFVPAAPRGLWWRKRDVGPAFMVAELEPGALDGLEGEVGYDPAFDAL